MGPKPPFGIVVIDYNDRYLVPGENFCLKAQYQKDALESGYPRRFFFEVFVSKDFEVNEEVLRDFYAKDTEAQNKVLKLAEEKAKDFKAAMDLIAGVIGLRFHRQFVIKPLSENPVALRGNDDFVISIMGPIIERLEGISLT
jgi:hypothetical protein